MSEHTEGPWTVDVGVSSYVAAIRKNWDGGRHTVAYVEGPGVSSAAGTYTRRLVRGMANAQLIAAAPELLESVKDLVALVDRRNRGFDQTVSIGDLTEQLILRADYAIAKAEGR